MRQKKAKVRWPKKTKGGMIDWLKKAKAAHRGAAQGQDCMTTATKAKENTRVLIAMTTAKEMALSAAGIAKVKARNSNGINAVGKEHKVGGRTVTGKDLAGGDSRAVRLSGPQSAFAASVLPPPTTESEDSG